jgi:thiosulfate/3-mercaptopyruvate sulfurtransferase
VFESPQSNIEVATVVIDARPAFEFDVAHVPGSIRLSWTDFTRIGNANTNKYGRSNPSGDLEPDLFSAARRLARYGIDPKTSVLIVGGVPEHLADMGRLAWTFKYLGISNVKTMSIDKLKFPLTKELSQPQDAKPLWKPEYDAGIDCVKDDFWKYIKLRDKEHKSVFILDVRDEKEYLGKVSDGLSQKVPDIGAINIPMNQFFTKLGEPDPHIADRLTQVGVTTLSQLVVVDNKGIRSGAATFALLALGYKACNVSGGLQSIF